MISISSIVGFLATKVTILVLSNGFGLEIAASATTFLGRGTALALGPGASRQSRYFS